ncbi:Wzz/FepE/Etk N-terminal domain-containing protein [Planococcus sp. 11815]|uniref:YveK family protein n=1 Tax=Planococcus sp. 11815 TaxID=2939413 RepID=UPI003C87A05E
MEETIRLQDIYNTIRKRIGLIALVTVLSIAIVGLISYFVLSPVYEASTEILVNQSPAEAELLMNENIQANLQLASTYTGILKNPIILDQVMDELNLDMSRAKLSDKISVSNTEQTQLITITVKDENPEMATEIANTTATVFETVIQELMNVDNVTILSPAAFKGDPVPVSPNPILNMAVAAIIGVMLALGIVLLLVYMNKTKKLEE